MDKDFAAKIVRKTFQNSFDKNSFVYFIQNLFNHIEIEDKHPYSGNFIPDPYKPFISTLKRVAKYVDSNDKKIDILVVNLKRETLLERARSMQRNFIGWYLNGSRGGILKDAALVAFVSPNSEDWRFSLIEMDYKINQGKVKQELTPARRFSFLVGENESSHTAQSHLAPILQDDVNDPTLKDLKDAFNVEKVTKEFFEKYRDLFLKIKDGLDKIIAQDKKIEKDFSEKNIASANFAKKLLGQIVFLYFLQKKGWFGVARDSNWGTGPKDFLRQLFNKDYGKYKNFFNDILEPLFYQALRYDRSTDDDYFAQFGCRIPFLNGGLFDPMENYDWVHTDILLSNELFSNNNKTKEGDIGDGILDIFDRYNFTVKEDEPLEKEVAIDPEMLGKVFENLLEVKDRKSKGTYYTPREIVHYMCQESLINYLYSELNPNYGQTGETEQGKLLKTKEPKQKTISLSKFKENIPKKDIEILIRYGEMAVEYEAIYFEKMSKGSEYKGKYSKAKLPKNIEKNAKLIDEKLANIRVCDPAVGSAAFPVGMMNEIVRARRVLTNYLKDKKQRTTYDFKRHAIRNCLYGVDIDPGAIEIAKLRLWLSLIVDEQDIKKIKPLPNLDYKIVCGNSLLGVEKNLFNRELFAELEKLKPLFFSETNTKKKQGYKKQIDELINQITNGRKDFDFEIYFSEVFHEKGGFDVVIANPPYVSHDKIQEKKLIEKNFRSYEPFADLYCYFIEIAINLQNKRGFFCYITSNSYLKARYGRPLRNLILEKEFILEVINIEDFQVFDAAIVNTAVLMAQRNCNRKTPMCLIVNASYKGNETFGKFIEENKFYYSQDDFRTGSWYLLSVEKLNLKKKIERTGKTLEEYGTKIRLGIATGSNKIFVIDEDLGNELINKDPKNAKIIKPVLRGRDIFRYKYEFSNNYILLTENSIDVKKEYPEVYRYLDSFGKIFRKRGAKGKHWSNLRPTAFLNDFKKDKIIWIELTDVARFALCTEEIYLLNSAYFLIPPAQFLIKFLLAILNSKLIEFYLGSIAGTSGMGTTRWINNYVKEFRIPDIGKCAQKPIIGLVDKILAITKDEDYLVNPIKQAKVADYEKQIDQLVYKLYGLTKGEVKIIENFNKE